MLVTLECAGDAAPGAAGEPKASPAAAAVAAALQLKRRLSMLFGRDLATLHEKLTLPAPPGITLYGEPHVSDAAKAKGE